MKVQTLFVTAVLLGLCASTVSAQFGYEVFFDRFEFAEQGYFVDFRFDFGTYLDTFLPIGNYFVEYEGSARGSGVYTGFYSSYSFSQYYEYFNADTTLAEVGSVVPLTGSLYSDTYDYLLGGIGNGYIFSTGPGIGLDFTFDFFTGLPAAAGIFTDAAGDLHDESLLVGGYVNYEYIRRSIDADSHTQFFGINSYNYGVEQIGFAWDPEVVANPPDDRSTEVGTVRKADGSVSLDPEFYQDKAYMVADEPTRAGLNHVLLPAPYVGNVINGQSNRSVDTVVNVVDHESMSVNMVMSADNHFSAAGFTLASGAQLFVEAGAEGDFAVTFDGSDLTFGDVVTESDFKVMYDEFENMPRTAISGGHSWFEMNFEDQEHTAMVRVASQDLVVDVSLSTNNGEALLNVNMRELQQHPTASGLLRNLDNLARLSAKTGRSVNDSHLDSLVAANTVDSLF